MKLAFCIDDARGMLWGGRRQSRDRVLCARIAEHARACGLPLYVTPYTAKLFDGEDVCLLNEPQPPRDAFYFAEDGALPLASADTVYLYHWGRHYPADRFFEEDLAALGFVLRSSETFAGSSHDAVLEEIYQRA